MKNAYSYLGIKGIVSYSHIYFYFFCSYSAKRTGLLQKKKDTNSPHDIIPGANKRDLWPVLQVLITSASPWSHEQRNLALMVNCGILLGYRMHATQCLLFLVCLWSHILYAQPSTFSPKLTCILYWAPFPFPQCPYLLPCSLHLMTHISWIVTTGSARHH